MLLFGSAASCTRSLHASSTTCRLVTRSAVGRTKVRLSLFAHSLPTLSHAPNHANQPTPPPPTSVFPFGTLPCVCVCVSVCVRESPGARWPSTPSYTTVPYCTVLCYVQGQPDCSVVSGAKGLFTLPGTSAMLLASSLPRSPHVCQLLEMSYCPSVSCRAGSPCALCAVPH